MQYDILFLSRARKDLDALSSVERDRILEKIVQLGDNLRGDVKHLVNFEPAYRLRVGNYRLLFDVIKSEVLVQRVLHRSKAYKGK